MLVIGVKARGEIENFHISHVLVGLVAFHDQVGRSQISVNDFKVIQELYKLGNFLDHLRQKAAVLLNDLVEVLVLHRVAQLVVQPHVLDRAQALGQSLLPKLVAQERVLVRVKVVVQLQDLLDTFVCDLLFLQVFYSLGLLAAFFLSLFQGNGCCFFELFDVLDWHELILVVVLRVLEYEFVEPELLQHTFFNLAIVILGELLQCDELFGLLVADQPRNPAIVRLQHIHFGEDRVRNSDSKLNNLRNRELLGDQMIPRIILGFSLFNLKNFFMLITLLNILFNQFFQMLYFKSRINFLVMSNMEIIHIDLVHHLFI